MYEILYPVPSKIPWDPIHLVQESISARMSDFWDFLGGHGRTGGASFVPSFRPGKRTEAELKEIAANNLKISALNWTKLCAKLEFEDLRRLDDDLIRPEDSRLSPEGMKWVEAQTTPSDVVQLMLDLTLSEMQRVQVWVKHAERKAVAQSHRQHSHSHLNHCQQSRPAPAPSSSSSHYSRPAPPPTSSHSSGPFIPSLRTGRRTETELREIASNIHNIRPIDFCRLYAKLELQDSLRLLDELLSPETVKQHIRETQFKVAPMEFGQLYLELDPSEFARLEQVMKTMAAIDVPLNAAEEKEKAAYMSSLNAQMAALQANQDARNELSNMRVRASKNNMRLSANAIAELGCIGTNDRIVDKDEYGF